MPSLRCLVATLLLAGCAAGPATSNPPSDREATFNQWLEDFGAEARQAGVAAKVVEEAFGEARYLPDVIERDRHQPEFTRAIWEYLDSAVSEARVETGRQMLVEHAEAIRAAEKRYGVPGKVLVAIWGIESNFGRNFGDTATVDALATLAFEGRRQSFAERELLAALKILEDGDIARQRMRGSWAGAMGHTQFLPTSFRAYAVDADGDERRDIWGSIPDVMASTANYLAKAGWRDDEGWGVELRLPEDFDYRNADRGERRDSAQWQDAGLRTATGDALPAMAEARVLLPAGAEGPAFLVGKNFDAILRYNNATSYALAVGLLADRIDGGDGIGDPWPREQEALSRDEIETMQRLLNARGFDVGKPDGLAGPRTRSGLREFQASIGAVPDAFPTRELLETLQKTDRATESKP